jgi:hypothetical protein
MKMTANEMFNLNPFNTTLGHWVTERVNIFALIGLIFSVAIVWFCIFGICLLCGTLCHIKYKERREKKGPEKYDFVCKYSKKLNDKNKVFLERIKKYKTEEDLSKLVDPRNDLVDVETP